MPIPRGSAGRRVAETRLSERRRSAAQADGTPLVWVALATACGAVASALVPAIGAWLVGGLVGVFLVAWLVAWSRERDVAACGFLLSAIAAFGAGWASLAWHQFSVDEIGRFARRDAEPACLEVVVTSLPKIYPAANHSPFRAIPSHERTVLEVTADSLRNATDWRDAGGRCEITVAGRLEGVRPGDRLRVFGQLRRPTQASNPGQRDAAIRERAVRRLALVWAEAPECVTPLASAESRFGRAAADSRAWALNQVDERIEGEAASLVKAMLLGDGSALPEETVEAFRRTGTLHVLVVSGLHVGLVAAVLPGLAALGLIPRRAAWLGALVLVCLYVVLAGARPPAVRAGVVAVAACVAAISGRRPISANSLAGAGVAVFALSPGAWLGVGTLLSFLAAATLLVVAAWAARRRARVTPPLERLIQSTRSPADRLARRGLRWTGWVMAATVAVQLATGPLVASEFHLVSPAATPLALVVSPLIALTVGVGVLLLAAEAIGLTWLAALAGYVSGTASAWLGEAVTTTAAVPLAGFWTPGPPSWWSAAWIGWIAVTAAIRVYRLPMRSFAWRGALALAAALFGPVLWGTLASPAELRCSFIDVGHGSATLLESPEGATVLVDAGALGSPERVTDVVARTLWSRGIRRLDAVILTHPDIDHYNAVPGLLERFDLGGVWTTPQMFPLHDDPADRSGPAELKRLLIRSGVSIREIVQGERLRVGAARLEVMHPDELGVIGSDNANSLVLGVEFGGKRVLLPGDLEAAGVDRLLAQEPYDCDVLLAPHHGSRLSNPPGFAGWSLPETVIISSGEHREEAVAAYARSGARVLSTYELGMISVAISERSVKVAMPLRSGR